jgi:hypothetical protein
MIYGDWEDGYEQLPVLFNAMHGRMGGRYSFMLF